MSEVTPETAPNPNTNCTSCSGCEGCPDKGVNATPAAPDPNALQDFVIKVPASVPPEVVRAALSIGQMVTQAISQRCMVIFFPQAMKDAKGNSRLAAGHCVVPVSNPSDIVRILKLADVTGKVNDAVANGVGAQPADRVVAAANGELLKENAARDITAKAEGKVGGILIASN